jgi:3-oxoacyl-[acyl-carrier protein] reductase
MLLMDKTAVIYGGAGLLGGAVARAFAREGATVFLAGRTRAPLEAVAADVIAGGGTAHSAEVDALDEAAVEAHADEVMAQAGRVDVSFNAIGIRGDLQGTPLVDLTLEDYGTPIALGTTTQFLTARAAARRMVEQGAGVILLPTATATWSRTALARPIPMGGYGVACAGIEALARSLASELGPRGVRVACLRCEGVAELFAMIEQGPPVDWIQAADMPRSLAGENLLRRLPTAAEVADVATFLASDRATALTATIANVSCGAIVE